MLTHRKDLRVSTAAVYEAHEYMSVKCSTRDTQEPHRVGAVQNKTGREGACCGVEICACFIGGVSSFNRTCSTIPTSVAAGMYDVALLTSGVGL